MGPAEALPGPDFLVAAGGQQPGQPARLKLGLIADGKLFRPAGQLPVVFGRHRGQQIEIGPPPRLHLFAAGGQLLVQHLQQVQFFPQGTFQPGRGAAQQTVFLL